MPPVRDASTKPSAATVLPAPVACSNQKRLPAFGSSGASASCSSSSSAGARPSPAAPRARPRRRSSSPGMPTGASCELVLGDARRCRCRCRCAAASASSAVSVPDSASTWWAESTVPSTSVRLVLAEQPLEAEQQREPSAARRPTAPWRRRRSPPAQRRAPGGAAVPGASAIAASSPSERNGSRVNFDARSMSSDDGRVVAVVATGVVSAMKARFGERPRSAPRGLARCGELWGSDVEPGSCARRPSESVVPASAPLLQQTTVARSADLPP